MISVVIIHLFHKIEIDVLVTKVKLKQENYSCNSEAHIFSDPVASRGDCC